jgi:acyl-CoA synthetase (NDP forming)
MESGRKKDMRNSKALIDSFLAARRIAMIGASRNEKHFSRALMRTFVERGYDVVPVNPGAAEIAGLRAFPSIEAVEPAPEAALVLTPASQSAAVIEQCARAGVKRIWLYRAVGAGSVSRDAVEACDRLGLPVVAGECPFMFFPNTEWIHRMHRGWRTLIGAAPR